MSLRKKLSLSFVVLAAIETGLAAAMLWQSHAIISQYIGRDAIWGVELRFVLLAGGFIAAGAAAWFMVARLSARAAGCLNHAIAAYDENDPNRCVEFACDEVFKQAAAGFDQMAGQVRGLRAELTQKTTAMEHRIAEQVGEMGHLQERLRQSQFDLMQYEKMSMLGQLAAGVAHEVNTPTGAIINTSADAAHHLHELLAVATTPDKLPADCRDWLAGVLDSLFSGQAMHKESVVRNERRQVEKRLRELGYANPRRMADVIAEYGLVSCAGDEAFLRRISQVQVLSMLEHAMALKVSLDISEISAKKIARIVRSLRFYAHSNQDNLSDIDVNESIDHTLAIMQNRIKLVAEVRPSYGEGLPMLKCGADLMQVWTNILSNACDAIESVRKDDHGLIDITTSMDGNDIVVNISNEGPPIPQEYIERVFEPFFTTKNAGKGMGLGLSLCVNILRKYDGSITAVNEPPLVSFLVRLPTAGRALSCDTPVEPVAAETGGVFSV